MASRLAEEAARPFDLAAGPLVRAGLLRLGPLEHVVLFNLHHIVADGLSSNVGVGAVDGSAMAASAATSGAMRVLVHAVPEELPSGLWCYRVDASRSLLGGAVNDVGRAVSWLESTIRLDAGSSLDAVAAAAERAGFATLWSGEHVVMVDESASRYPYSDDGLIAVPADADWIDPMIGLSFAAAASTGGGISCAPANGCQSRTAPAATSRSRSVSATANGSS